MGVGAVLVLYVHRGAEAVVCIYHTAWAVIALLILTWGQCEGLVVGIGTRETYSHVFLFP